METKNAILLSLRPEWVVPIFITKTKIYEVRKRVPSIKPPYKVYVYCTKGKPSICRKSRSWDGGINGYVCGEFTCKDVHEMCSPWKGKNIGTGLTEGQLSEYSNLGNLYFMEVDDPILFAKPMKLEDLGISYVPQSWVYVEENENG